MDELLHGRVTQLRGIDERLEAIIESDRGSTTAARLRDLRDDLARMIVEAEAEYEAF